MAGLGVEIEELQRLAYPVVCDAEGAKPAGNTEGGSQESGYHH